MIQHQVCLVSLIVLWVSPILKISSRPSFLLAVYLLDEVVQMVGSSNKNISDAVEIIQQRLQHRTATVKQKVEP